MLIYTAAYSFDAGDENGSAATDDSINNEQPNIIVMYSDDHTAQAVGAYRGVLNYGLQLDHTPSPNIDRLAEGGIRFDNAFVTNSICKPSRAVMMIYNHKAPHREWLPGPALDDYHDGDLPEPSTLFYDYSGLTTAAHEQDMEIGEVGRSNFVWCRDLKVPLHPETGSVSEQLVQNLDFAPTILELAGAEIPDRMQGRSIVSLLRGEQPGEWRDAVYYQYFEGPEMEGVWHEVARHYGIRTHR